LPGGVLTYVRAEAPSDDDAIDHAGTDRPVVEATGAGLFERQVVRVPDAIAVAEHDRFLTYAALDARASQIARELIASGVSAETIVGIAVRRTLATPLAILAVWKAGGAYLPLDCAYPLPHLALMLERVAVPIIVAESS